MKVCLAQINPTIGDLNGNLKTILHYIQKAKALSADIVLFPEMCLCGYPPGDFLLLPPFIKAIEECIPKICQESKGIISVVGLPRYNPAQKEKNLYNSAIIIDDGEIIGYYDKVLLPTYDVFAEKRYFEPGENRGVYSLKGKKVAITICEDMWQPSEYLKYTTYWRNPIRELKEFAPDLFLNLSASPYSTTKFPFRLDACVQAAKELGCPAILCNQVGANDSLVFDGYSLAVDAAGNLITLANGFQEDCVLVDLEKKSSPLPIPAEKIGDLYKALVLGVHDYFKKSGFKKACLGLSGGIDSSLVACIAVDALGKENVLGISMPSRYTSEDSRKDALLLAKNLGIEFKEISIEGPFPVFLELLTPHFNGKKTDTTEENIQARIRGIILMALSNKHGYIVLSTGNKSELALGYATLYGDTCGGVSVINDVTKRQVYELARWINRDKEIIPANCLTKPPSAELRPNQKDSDSLPSYDIIDDVLHAYVEEHKSAEEIVEKFGYSPDLVEDLIKKIHRNEYKRRQSPPGLRVSEKAFSVGRFFPIVQRWTS